MAAVILTAGVSLSILALALGAVLQDEVISEQGATLLATAFGASIGAVATYLGGRMRSRDGDEEPQ